MLYLRKTKQSKKYILMLSVFILVFGTLSVNAGSCEYCSGYVPWSNVSPPPPPDCEDRIKTRTLGSCVSGTTGSCSESSRWTKVTYTYSLYVPLEKEQECYISFLVCSALCVPYDEPEYSLCSIECAQEWIDCLREFEECVFESQTYSDLETGCS